MFFQWKVQLVMTSKTTNGPKTKRHFGSKKLAAAIMDQGKHEGTFLVVPPFNPGKPLFI